MTCKNNKIIYLKGFYFFRCTSFWFYINKIVMSINHSSTSFNFCNAITKIKIQNFMYYFIDIWSKTYIIPNISFWFCNTAFLFRRVLMDEEKQRRPPDSCPIIFDSWYGEFHLKTLHIAHIRCNAPRFVLLLNSNELSLSVAAAFIFYLEQRYVYLQKCTFTQLS